MLDSLYLTLFRPRSGPAPLSWAGAWALWSLLAAHGALSFAGKLGLGTAGLFALTLGLLALYGLGWFWLSAAAGLFAQLLGGVGSGPSTMQAIAAAFWPALLEAPVSAMPVRVSGILGLLVAAWVVVNLVRAIALGHHLGVGRATLSLVGAALAVLFGLGMLILVPVTLVVLAFA